jgi:hypothetical protein
VNPHFDAAAELARIGRFVPVHLVWGAQSDLMCVFQTCLCISPR